jgi:hypothetical protein
MEITFAKINAMGTVENVIVAGQDFIDSLPDASSYVQTWADASGDAAKGYNFASIGGKFDPKANAFTAPQPFASWVLDAKFQWQAPIAYPAPKAGFFYTWDEAAVNWKENPIPTPETV